MEEDAVTPDAMQVSAGTAVIWDFDETLAQRPGRWTGCLREVLDELAPGHGIQESAIAAHLKTGFPWHSPWRSHPELSSPAEWWKTVEELLANAFQRLGVAQTRARDFAMRAHERYADGEVSWQTYPDAEPALDRLARAGVPQFMLSNHVPELPSIVDSLGLHGYFERIFTSAAIGFEKPHPESYGTAIRAIGPARSTWMIGDNPEADCRGAERRGIKGILLRREPHDERTPAAIERCASDLRQAVAMILDPTT
ncbi:HAD family hydrolase [Saccharopolyspora shandongensis]|uniref:HAD family hydrolase n=1 Tax=Saccharopolyspora shandongensis TaxID=418495 RepID=UPI0033EE6117